MKLYTNPFSPNGKRVQVLCEELGLKLQIVNLDFAKGENKTPEYMQKNPMGKVPTLEEDDGSCYWESPAICAYLAMKHPEKNLTSNDPKVRATGMQWTFWNASHLEESIFEVAFETMIKPMLGQPQDAARIEHGKANFARYAPVLNGHLEGRAWITGNQFTIADIILGTTIEFSTKAGFEYTRYPHIEGWLRRLQAREAWKRASA